ncbi:MAG: cadmium-translocating P-type ATPase, partial [Chloroflexi bacterium]|nr:cadmium-translocating P-type ATPase [Chloroflexota bacterium]
MTTLASKTYKVQGMDCAHCAEKLQKGVGQLDGVQAVQVDFATGKLHLTGAVPQPVLEQRVKSLGYELADVEAPTVKSPQNRGGVIGFWDYLTSRRATQLSLVGGGLILVAAVLALLGLPDIVTNAMFVGAMAIAAYPIARSGINTLFINRDFNINLLMTIAAVGAVIIGEYMESATVIFLFAIGEALEGYTTDRARQSIRGLLDLTPPQAIRTLGILEEVVPVEALKIGDVILIKPGERVAMDGEVVGGTSHVNQAPITGESVPVFKEMGAEVFAGTVNGEGLLHVRVTRLAQDNTLNRIIQLVEEAQGVRAPSQRLIDQFSRWYTPTVVVLALLVATIPPLLFGGSFWNAADGTHGWFYRALSLLVISCPCALVISAPVTVISAITAAARQGVLIKGGAHLEALGQVKAVAFDKTGTLTQGQPMVMTTRSIDCTTGNECELCDDVLALAAAVEKRSTHPLARAVVNAAEQRGLANTYVPAENVATLAGRGVQGQV